MNVSQFLEILRQHPDHGLSFTLPDGSRVPAHFHITEVGHWQKNFVDCGGTRRSLASCVLQTWVAEDTDHRLLAGKLVTIFRHAAELLPSDELPVEIEHEAPVISQFPVTGVEVTDQSLVFQLGLKHTDCLAKDLCLPGVCGPLPAVPQRGKTDTCAAGSGCC